MIVAKVRFRENLRSVTQQVQPTQHNSDELIADLVIQLGDAHVPFMHIRTTYCHSAFPEYGGPDVVSGLACVQSRIETTGTASLRRNNVLSSWSPISCSNSDAIFDLMKKHWGVVRAAELMRLVQQDTSDVNCREACEPRSVREPSRQSSVSRRQFSWQSQSVAGPKGLLRFKSSPYLPARLKSARSLSKSIRSSLHSTNGRSESRVSLGHEVKSPLRKSENDLQQTGATIASSGKDVGFWGWGSWF